MDHFLFHDPELGLFEANVTPQNDGKTAEFTLCGKAVDPSTVGQRSAGSCQHFLLLLFPLLRRYDTGLRSHMIVCGPLPTPVPGQDERGCVGDGRRPL